MRKIFLFIVLGFALALNSNSAGCDAGPGGGNRLAGRWKGKLHFESQDSYRGNNAKGKHRSEDSEWIFEISSDEKAITYHRITWKGPTSPVKLVNKDSNSVTWHESEKQSAELKPKVFYDQNGRRMATGIGISADFDADWSIHLVNDRTATVACSANREDIYARITDIQVTGTLKKIR
jgi:hypothetical protein